jgi:hypothetical protein
MLCQARLYFAFVALLLGVVCLGYALYLVQSDGPTPSRSSGIVVAGVVAFGLAGGLCVLAASVALNGQSGGRGPADRGGSQDA